MNMKKTKPKKLLTVLLTLYLALSIVPITAYAGVTDVTGGTTTNHYSHFYHTKVETTAQVTIKDADGNVIETTEVTKSGDFVEGNVNSDAVQAEIKRIDDEINAQYSSRGSITIENRNGNMVFDHFESSNIIGMTPGDNILVGDQDALENAASGSVNKNLVVHEYQVYQTTYDLIVQAIDGGSQDEATINNAYIRNVKFAYRSGDTPQATAEVLVDPLFEEYEIAYECWEEMENGEPVAFWYSDESKYTPSMKKITQFEDGKTYMYSIELREKNGYTFADNCSVTINGNPISATAIAVKTVDGLFVMNVDMINPKPAFKEISVVEINNATLTFKDGDKPVFTGTTPDDAPYVLVFEEWRTDGEWTRSDEWFNNADHHGNDKDITAFDKNKSYNYTFYIKTNHKAYEEGWCFGQNTKLKINGKEVSLTRDVSDNEHHFSGATDIIMTPTAEISVIEINNATLTFKDGDKPVFTGTVPENDQYAFRCEWWSLDENTGIVSTEPEWGGDIYKNKITAFEAGKTYHYGVYVTAYTADISPDAKLKINGREVKYTRIGDESDTQSFWVETDLTMTPAADGHTHKYGTEWKYDETNHWHECECDNKADITAHTFKWIVDRKATTAEKGSKHEECTVCGYKKDAVDIPKIDSHNHNYGTEWKYDETNHWHECEDGEKADITAHNFKWIVDRKATATEKGSKHEECTVCGYKKAAVDIPVTDFGNSSDDQPNKPTNTVSSESSSADQLNNTANTASPKTGNSGNIILWIALLFVSGGVFIAATAVDRKKTKNK
jgi:Zn ribbon nucleic-acid-binding protein